MQSKVTLQEAINRCLANGITPNKINEALMTIALEEIEREKRLYKLQKKITLLCFCGFCSLITLILKNPQENFYIIRIAVSIIGVASGLGLAYTAFNDYADYRDKNNKEYE